MLLVALLAACPEPAETGTGTLVVTVVDTDAEDVTSSVFSIGVRSGEEGQSVDDWTLGEPFTFSSVPAGEVTVEAEGSWGHPEPDTGGYGGEGCTGSATATVRDGETTETTVEVTCDSWAD